MSIADLMQRMSDAGAPMEAIVLAVRALEEKDAELAAKRATERDRKRRQRERQRDSHGTVTGQSGDITGQPPILDKESSPQTPFKEINPTPANTTRARRDYPIPDGISAEQWGAFCGQRKKKLNDHAYSLLCNKLKDLAEAGWPPGEMIDRAIEHGWETVFAPKFEENRNGPRKRPANDGLGVTARAALDVFGYDALGRS